MSDDPDESDAPDDPDVPAFDVPALDVPDDRRDALDDPFRAFRVDVF